MTGKEFWQKVFCEEDGMPSLSRVVTGVLAIFSGGWITHLVLHHNALPDLTGISLFLGTLYGLNRVAAVVESITGPKNP